AYTAQAAGYAGVIAGATKARDEAVAQAAASRAEAERMEAMLDAVRRAPSEDLRRRLGDTLGDMGPVSLHVTDTGVDVRFDGREWRRSSRGRQVVCGLILRDALRQASALRWLPLLVDDASAWSGTWPACAGQVVYMVTAPGDGLTVSEGAP
ncbi:MAG: hypothetical protein GY913_27305, partial [Proteobacteria bacterium]|nr:hypothetical protein [Pseudomonadota bacterium]